MNNLDQIIDAIREYIENSEPRTVSDIYGASVTYDLFDIHPSEFGRGLAEGFDECLRDARASALVVAFGEAHPDIENPGHKDHQAARNLWKDKNQAKIRKAGQALMESKLEQLRDGTRHVSLGNGSTDPLDQFRVNTIKAFMATEKGKATKAAHDAIVTEDGKADTAARRTFLIKLCKGRDTFEAQAQKAFTDAQATMADLAESVEDADLDAAIAAALA